MSRDQPRSLGLSLAPAAHGFNAVKLGFRVDLARAADRALHVLADPGHGCFRGQGHHAGINVARVAAFAAMDPQQLIAAHQVTEGNGAIHRQRCRASVVQSAEANTSSSKRLVDTPHAICNRNSTPHWQHRRDTARLLYRSGAASADHAPYPQEDHGSTRGYRDGGDVETCIVAKTED